MIPIYYRLDPTAEKEYIDKALSCLNSPYLYSSNLNFLLTRMKQEGLSVAEEILSDAKRFESDYPYSWCLCKWLVMTYEEMAEVKKYLHELICSDLLKINSFGIISKITTYHDLQSRMEKDANIHACISNILLADAGYYQIYSIFRNFISIYGKWSQKKINYWITEKTGLKVCPYCNISYTYNREDTVTAQLDHFFPKSEYPIFALCFYNLIPSCPTCNKIKHVDTNEMASPYKNGAFKDLHFTWEYKNNTSSKKRSSMATLEEMIEIKIKTPEKEEQYNLSTLKINDAYQQHKDYASEIIMKATTYTNPEAQKLICDIGASVGITPEEVERFYLGNYLNEDDLKKRPLSKMTKDFYQEICHAKAF